MKRVPFLWLLFVLLLLPLPEAAGAQAPVNDLARFPRPANDNGWGIHWVPTLFGQSTDVVDRFLGEADQLGVRWVKVMQPDQEKVEHVYLLHSLVQRGMMPVLRVYKQYNTPYEHLGGLVRAARPLGVFYYELYNEPNIDGEAGGWPGNGPANAAATVEAMAALWLPAAREVIAAGGFPSLPSLSPGGNYEDLAFLRAFFRRVKQLGGGDALSSSWLALHNYSLNHPLAYPNDPVNLTSAPLTPEEITARGLSDEEVRLISEARRMSRLPRSQGGYYVGDTVDQDSNGFRKFEAYEKIALEETGRAMPVITTEGGAIPGTQEDPRYPKTTDADVAEQTVAAFRYMTEQAPDYYFAFSPWLIANYAAGNMDGRWESAAWFQGTEGKAAPVVLAVRELAKTGARRTLTGATPAAKAAPGGQGSRPGATPPATPAPTRPSATAASGAPPSSAPLALPTPKPGWVIFWRDDTVFNCAAVDLNAVERMLQTWQPPRDGHRWSMDIRDSAGKRLAAVGQLSSSASSQSAAVRFGPLAGACPQMQEAAAPAPTPTPPETPAATRPPAPARKWDQRLDQLGIKVTNAAGSGAAWKLISARFEDETQSGGRHNIYIRLLDPQGRPTTGTTTVSWSTGSYTMDVVAADLNRTDPYETYGANFPIYGQVGSYSVTVRGADGGPAETISGLGMLGKQHVNYILIFQRQ